MILPSVSLITPSHNRGQFLIEQYQQLTQQTLRTWEWIILYSSQQYNPFFAQLTDTRVHYYHAPDTQLSIGEKRNCCVHLANAHIIAHIDDDDFYAPQYLETYLPTVSAQTPFVKLLAWYIHSIPQNFWGFFDPTSENLTHFEVSPKAAVTTKITQQYDSTMQWGYGFSYWYLKELALAYPFPALNFGEDHHWVLGKLQPAGVPLTGLKDETGLVLHLLHNNNTSASFPQYFLSEWHIPKAFKQYQQQQHIEVLIPNHQVATH